MTRRCQASSSAIAPWRGTGRPVATSGSGLGIPHPSRRGADTELINVLFMQAFSTESRNILSIYQYQRARNAYGGIRRGAFGGIGRAAAGRSGPAQPALRPTPI